MLEQQQGRRGRVGPGAEERRHSRPQDTTPAAALAGPLAQRPRFLRPSRGRDAGVIFSAMLHASLVPLRFATVRMSHGIAPDRTAIVRPPQVRISQRWPFGSEEDPV